MEEQNGAKEKEDMYKGRDEGRELMKVWEKNELKKIRGMEG